MRSGGGVAEDEHCFAQSCSDRTTVFVSRQVAVADSSRSESSRLRHIGIEGDPISLSRELVVTSEALQGAKGAKATKSQIRSEPVRDRKRTRSNESSDYPKDCIELIQEG